MRDEKSTGTAAKAKSGTRSAAYDADYDAKVEKQINNTSDTIADQAGNYAAITVARNNFMAATVNLGWRLAITVLVPIFIGAKLDDRFKSTPSYTLAALTIAIFLSAMVVNKTIKEITAAQALQLLEDKALKNKKDASA